MYIYIYIYIYIYYILCILYILFHRVYSVSIEESIKQVHTRGYVLECSSCPHMFIVSH